MNKKLLFGLTLIAGFIFSNTSFAQQRKFWVMFKNKTGTPYSLSAGTGYLSVKSLQRRMNQGIMLDNTDLPVTPSYVNQIAAVPNVTIMERSKWLNGVVVLISTTSTATALSAINSFSFVQSSYPVNRYKLTFPVIPKLEELNNVTAKTESTTAYNYGASLNQAQMIGADCLHSMGYRGQGMTIAVLDAGFTDVQNFDIFDSLFMQGRLLGTRDFVDGFGDTTVFTEHPHGAECLSTMAGIKSGSIIGTAPKAKYWLLRTEDAATETISEEYNWVRGAEFADSVGADVCSTSLGYTIFDGGLNNHSYPQLDGRTAPMSIAANLAARKGMLMFNAAGNEGCPSGPPGCWYYISVPSDADSIITVGAVDPSGNKAGFSSFGPTADGRIKPDLVSQGQSAIVCLYGSGCFPGNGTSFSTPILAGAATCLWQSKSLATNMQILHAMKATADSASTPDNRIGWGIPHMCSARAYLTSIGVSVKEYEADHNIRIYPNPFSGEVNIWINDLPSQNIRVNITNVLGQTLYDQVMTGPNGGVVHLTEVAEYKPGIYFVNLTSGDIKITKKIVKQ